MAITIGLFAAIILALFIALLVIVNISTCSTVSIKASAIITGSLISAMLIWLFVGSEISHDSREITGYHMVQNIEIENGSQISIIEFEGWEKKRFNVSDIVHELLPEKTIIRIVKVKDIGACIIFSLEKKYEPIRPKSDEYKEVLDEYNKQDFIKNGR